MTGKGISLKREWWCPNCPVTLTTFVTLSVPPTHKCGRVGKTKQLQERGKQQ